MCEVKKIVFWSGVSKGAVPLMTNIIHVGIDRFDGLNREKWRKWLQRLKRSRLDNKDITKRRKRKETPVLIKKIRNMR